MDRLRLIIFGPGARLPLLSQLPVSLDLSTGSVCGYDLAVADEHLVGMAHDHAATVSQFVNAHANLAVAGSVNMSATSLRANVAECASGCLPALPPTQVVQPKPEMGVD